GRFRCISCSQVAEMCSDCIVKTHAQVPFHIIEMWDGTMWTRSTLMSLGLLVHLGHGGAPCPAPNGESRILHVVHNTGVQDAKFVFCGCSKTCVDDNKPYLQLFRARLFPATHKKPRTVVSFACLNDAHLLGNQGKLTASDYYLTLVRLSDNTDLDPPRRKFEEFARALRLWRHLKLLKRAGVVFINGGVESAPPGVCALKCLACPDSTYDEDDIDAMIPMPEEQGAENSMTLANTLFLMLDANFRLRSKDRKIRNDAPLGSGLSYIVNLILYYDYLQQCGPQTEMNICDSGLHAVDHANLRGSAEYRASGVGACQCRHMLVRPNGVGDLQRGERYCNMDYIFASATRGTKDRRVLISYDIACQWSRHFFSRMDTLPDDVRFDTAKNIVEFVIPKFHIAAHGKQCQSRYSLNFRRLNGRTDGENIERGWAWINPASLSTREMGPGAREDALDDAWAYWNWRISVKFGETLLRRFEEALCESVRHRRAHTRFSESFSGPVIKVWTDMVDAWDRDPDNAPNPYDEPETEESMIEVRRQLNSEEAEELSRGVMPLHATSASQFLVVGLELEDQQRSLASLRESVNTDKATTRALSVEDKDAALRRKIAIWQGVQKLYMPRIGEDVRPVDVNDDSVPAENIPLRLPSSLEPALRTRACVEGLVEKEKRLRLAQLSTRLHAVRKDLRVGSKIFNHRSRQTAGTGTKPNTRMQTLLKRFNDKAHLAAKAYRAAHTAMLGLDPDGAWSTKYKLLRDKDVKPLPRDADKQLSATTTATATATTTASSTTATTTATSTTATSRLRVEWATSLARTERWEEEVILVKVEMERVLKKLSREALRWRSKAQYRLSDVPPRFRRGITAYAEKKATLFESLAQDFANTW
ncbi:hypothetical protein SCHPADRAFT_794115, partial [Schizopora paradoxa]